MARTPLFGACKRWASLACLTERQRCPTREYVEQVWDTWWPTRREVLRVALGTATLAALPFAGCMSHSNSVERVAIVGAGLAGLHAAYRLRQAGVLAQV